MFNPRFSPAFEARLTDYGLLLIRGMLSVVYIFHGSQKLFGAFGGNGLQGTAQWLESIGMPVAMVSAVAIGCIEFFGGLALLLGVCTRIAALIIAAAMLVACFTAHTGFDAQAGGMEYPLTLAMVLIGLALIGPGRYSLDELWGRTSASPA